MSSLLRGHRRAPRRSRRAVHVVVPRVAALALAALGVAWAAPAAMAGSAQPYRPGIVVVGFKAGVPASLQRRLERRVGGRWKHPLGQASRAGRAAGRLERRIGTSVVVGVTRAGVLPAVRSLRRYRRWIRYAEPDYLMQASGVRVPSDLGFGLLWGSLNSGQLVQGVAGVVGADDRAVLAWGVATG